MIYLIFLAIFTGIDLLWLSNMIPTFYEEKLSHLELTIYLPGAIGAYILLSLAPMVFIFSRHGSNTHLFTFAREGALLGLIIYGVYEFTNLALLGGWPWSIVIVDTAWGVVLYATSVTLTAAVAKALRLF